MKKYRTVSELLDYNDDEHYEPDTSETEPGQAVNIKSVYERCLRGEMPPIKAGDFDIKGDMSVDEAFDTLDPTQSEGFDLADATAISIALNEKLTNSEELSTTSNGAAPSIASDGASAVGNSVAIEAAEN